ncbi:hypothetical protein HF086_018265 [Spodoptera exigua]|uniref:TRAF-type domain-containing protein n=1 Tax=Spodoptera exigua TaxID=7107 RepID=A0A922MXQ4_SPOEX|nr:hypothetical protein HF086_018265 [Spodoptera exigua]
MHQLKPCKKCGESVCGTDLEDHIRDSCAHTIKTCRFCELELPRRDLPGHESYCGVRTEQCPDCKEWVMIKYRQLHLDSNHGFIRLDDDPSPVTPKKELPKMPARPAVPKLTRANIATAPSTSNGSAYPPANSYRQNGLKNINLSRTEIRGISRGAVKKRPAPKPPCRRPPTDLPSAIRDLPYYSAMQRQQDEERQRREQTAYNLSVGLPPVLSPAAKLERLRKLDALQNPEEHMEKNRQGRIVRNLENDGASQSRPGPIEEPSKRRNDFKNLTPMTPEEFMVTAPYHSNPNISANANNNNNNNGNGRASPAGDDVRLPCEFCATLIPAHNLVQHQTGCRPDLAQLRPRSPSPVGAVALEPSQEPYDEPVIPCEFCYESLPVYLISEHQVLTN